MPISMGPSRLPERATTPGRSDSYHLLQGRKKEADVVLATVKDVAARAGVSPKTVSSVMNTTFSVAPATRERVERAMAELDSSPTSLPAGFATAVPG